jgi:uncharacterized protein (DUF305 family)
MNKNTLITLIAVIALLLGLIGGYLYSKSERGGNMMGYVPHRDSTEERVMDTKDTTSPTEVDNMHDMHDMGSVSSEREFIVEMIPHHQEAIDTAEQVIARGSNPEVRELAKSIVAAQEKEISDMKAWHLNWYGETYKDAGTYKPMMRDLNSLSGTELDRAFLEDMIMHHMGALMMAQAVAPYIEHPEMLTLAQNIAKTQSEEVVTMRILLQQ